MSPSMLALLAGLFAVPVLLLWLGHRLRRRSPAMRAVFWGATVGHVAGMLVSLLAMHLPPVLWDAAGWRTLAVYWGMVIGAAAGAVLGAARGFAGGGIRREAGPMGAPTGR